MQQHQIMTKSSRWRSSAAPGTGRHGTGRLLLWHHSPDPGSLEHTTARLSLRPGAPSPPHLARMRGRSKRIERLSAGCIKQLMLDLGGDNMPQKRLTVACRSPRPAARRQHSRLPRLQVRTLTAKDGARGPTGRRVCEQQCGRMVGKGRCFRTPRYFPKAGLAASH